MKVFNIILGLLLLMIAGSLVDQSNYKPKSDIIYITGLVTALVSILPISYASKRITNPKDKPEVNAADKQENNQFINRPDVIAHNMADNGSYYSYPTNQLLTQLDNDLYERQEGV